MVGAALPSLADAAAWLNGDGSVADSLRGQLKRLHPELDFPSDPGLAPGPSPTRPIGEAPGARVAPLGSTRVREGPLAGATPGRGGELQRVAL
jgi:hypothetical protein